MPSHLPAAPVSPARAASTAILLALTSFTVLALAVLLIASPAAPFAPAWPVEWILVLLGVLSTLGTAIGLVLHDRQLALHWYAHALAAATLAQAHAAAEPEQTVQTEPPGMQEVQPTAPKRIKQSSPPASGADAASTLLNSFAALQEIARDCATVLERQRDLLQTPIRPTEAAGIPSVADPLTGAATHSAFMSRLVPDVQFALQHQRPIAVALFDINDFRVVNNRFGHAFGDAVLSAVAERIRAELSANDLFGRLGGDRFAVAWAGYTHAAAQSSIDRILNAVAGKPFLVTTQQDAAEARVTLRAGLALCPEDATAAHALIELAEDALSNRAPGLPAFQGAARQDIQSTVTNGQDAMTSQPPALPQRPATPLSYIDIVTQKNSSIAALTSAMEAQDPTGQDRARRLAELAEATATILGRSQEEARLVGLAALLHDVGNLGIPQTILEKAEALSPEEWAFVREHPNLGQRLLTSVGGVLAAVAPMVAAHRERWDGKGYPAGQAGESIPLGARIVAVCDVYGALISDRPYRPALSHADAIAELRRQAGTQFDPQVVEAFIQAAQAE